MCHVDIVRDEPRQSVRRRVACVVDEGGRAVTHPTWSKRDYTGVVDDVLQSFGHRPDQLALLAAAFHTPYLGATVVHDDDSCPFSNGETTPLERVSYKDRHAGVDGLHACG